MKYRTLVEWRNEKPIGGKRAYAPIDSEMNTTILRSINDFDKYKIKIDNFFTDLYKDYLTLKNNPKFDAVSDDDFCFKSMYLYIVGKIKENPFTKNIDVNVVVYRFADYDTTRQILFNKLIGSITDDWHIINHQNQISQRNQIFMNDVNIINKHLDKTFYDYNIRRITNKSEAIRTKGENINEDLIQIKNKWQMTDKMCKQIKRNIQQQNRLFEAATKEPCENKQIVICSSIQYEYK